MIIASDEDPPTASNSEDAEGEEIDELDFDDDNEDEGQVDDIDMRADSNRSASPTKLTARQRSKQDGGFAEGLMVLPSRTFGYNSISSCTYTCFKEMVLNLELMRRV